MFEGIGQSLLELPVPVAIMNRRWGELQEQVPINAIPCRYSLEAGVIETDVPENRIEADYLDFKACLFESAGKTLC